MNTKNKTALALTLIVTVMLSVIGASQVELAKKTGLASLRADHVAIGVTNFEESVQWYKDKLGFREIVRWTVKELPGMQLAYLERNGFKVEIVSSAGTAATATPTDFTQALQTKGMAHLCFEVDDIDAAMDALKKKGVPAFVPAATYALEGSLYQRRVAFVRDNNGNLIEFAGELKK